MNLELILRMIWVTEIFAGSGSIETFCWSYCIMVNEDCLNSKIKKADNVENWILGWRKRLLFRKLLLLRNVNFLFTYGFRLVFIGPIIKRSFTLILTLIINRWPLLIGWGYHWMWLIFRLIIPLNGIDHQILLLDTVPILYWNHNFIWQY